MSITDVYGVFTDYTGTVKTKGNEFEDAKIEVAIQAESIDTDNEKRDDHLRSEDFFYVKEYPEIRFKSLSFIKAGEKLFEMQGELTMRGVTRTETFEALYNGLVEAGGQKRAAFKVTGSVNRFDYNIDWNKTFTKGLIVSREIEIICDISLITDNP